MTYLSKWSESQVYSIFESLGLKDQSSKDLPAIEPQVIRNTPSDKHMLFTRLSSNSIPPPSGKMTDADLENTSQ
jgi:hypothetical protein